MSGGTVDEGRLQANRLKGDVEQLRRDLQDVKDRADEALARLSNGSMPGLGGSVLGQAARDVEQRATRINTVVEFALEHNIMSTEQALAAFYGNPIPASTTPDPRRKEAP